jgi:hypothetical protein
MKTIAFLTVLIFTLGGCAATIKQTTLSDGTKGQLANCGGTKRDWGFCYDAATKVCPSGFDTTEKEEVSHGGFITRNLYFKCK